MAKAKKWSAPAILYVQKCQEEAGLTYWHANETPEDALNADLGVNAAGERVAEYRFVRMVRVEAVPTVPKITPIKG